MISVFFSLRLKLKRKHENKQLIQYSVNPKRRTRSKKAKFLSETLLMKETDACSSTLRGGEGQRSSC